MRKPEASHPDARAPRAPASARTLRVDAAHAGKMLDALVRELASEGAAAPVSWNHARELVRRGKVRVDGAICTEITRRIGKGAELVLDPAAKRLRENELSPDAILYVDADVVVVNKPAGLMSVPFEDEKNTLVDRVRLALRREATGKARVQGPELGVVQRLDKDTTGVMVFTRTLEAKRAMQQQFRAHSIERRYVGIAHGDVRAATYASDFIRDRGDGLKGSYGHFRRPRGPLPQDAQHAVTHVRPLQALRGATLVECQLETGRQHQIRIHLSEHGHPLVGEPVYIRDYEGPRIEAPRPMLHAAVLGFSHPRTGRSVRFSQPAPPDFEAMLRKLTPR